MLMNAKWISANKITKNSFVFLKNWSCEKEVVSASLSLTVTGVYEAILNGRRVGEFILAPGWTSYRFRLQYQTYDITELVQAENKLEIAVGKGWFSNRLPGVPSAVQDTIAQTPLALLAAIKLEYEDGTCEYIRSDETWGAKEGQVRFSDIYDGEIYDAAFTAKETVDVQVISQPTLELVLQQGPEIREQEQLVPRTMLTTPKGEVVIDFGQEFTGYIEINVTAEKGEVVDLSFAEILDKNGNFYNANYRSAKCQYHYICRDGKQTYKPKFTFYGMRYVRINDFPGGIDKAKTENFVGIVLHSEMKRTGFLQCSDAKLNRLFENVLWGQKGNFLDVPTDCPQRDERLGWTGDAQVFIKTACLNYDTKKFYEKWLADMMLEQPENGYIGPIIPEILGRVKSSAAWGDAAVICPWELYMAYADKELLATHFPMMKKWIHYITSTTTTPFLWTGGTHYGDWLGLDAPSGSYRGASRDDFIASAFYAYSVSLTIKAGKILQEDVREYEELYSKIVETFRDTFTEYQTQTECILAAKFLLAPEPQKAADQLAAKIRECGNQLQTGFVGTPYILHMLSDYGYTKLAYDLLLREEYPSWLYAVNKGATTIWEHWDGIMENGDVWSTKMNSYNHYAYGAVADWVYCVAAGINYVEDFPGYEKVKIAPHPDTRLEWLSATLNTLHGQIMSKWTRQGDYYRYDITTPVDAEVVIGDKIHFVSAGNYIFYSKC